jgi:hypothetical protein
MYGREQISGADRYTIYISGLNVGRDAMLLALLALMMTAINTLIYEI